MHENWIIKIIDKGFKTDRDIYIFRPLPNRRVEILRGDIAEVVEEDVEPKPSLMLSPEALQSFADSLASIGIKPQKGFCEGKLEAMEKHLVDLRTLLKLK